MTIKKKPEGQDFENWCGLWDEATHEGKVELARLGLVTYDTAKHWRSEGEVPIRKREEKLRMTITVPELLAMRPSVNLDFVCFDIETSNLKADFSILMVACIKPYGQEAITFRADDYPEWTSDRANDSKITKDIAKELRKHAIVIGHYSQKFDLPYFRAKMVKHGLEPLPPMFGIDTWRIAKNNFQVSSRRLQNLVRFFDIGEKGQVDGELWMRAAYNGDKESMDEIVDHCIKDVEVLEKLACISFPYLKSIPKL